MIFAEVEDQVLFKFRGLEKIDNINDTIMMQLLIQFQKYILSIDYSQYKYIYIFLSTSFPELKVISKYR